LTQGYPFISQTVHQPNRSSAKPFISQTVHLPNRSFAKPFICQTVHQPNRSSAKPFISQTVHLPNRSSAKPFICQTVYCASGYICKILSFVAALNRNVRDLGQIVNCQTRSPRTTQQPYNVHPMNLITAHSEREIAGRDSCDIV